MEIVESSNEDDNEDVLLCSAADTEKTQRFSSLIKVTVMLILLWQSIFKTANTSVEVLLQFMKILLPFFTE